MPLLLLMAAAMSWCTSLAHAATVTSVTDEVQFSADSASVVLGGTTTLRWSAAAGYACAASGGWTGVRPLSGSAITARLLAATTYVLTCTRLGVATRRSVTVGVDPPTVTLATSAGIISEGDPITLRWSSRSASACTASGGWTGARPGSGSELVVGTRAPTTFTLTCTGSAARSATASVRVQVRPTASVTLSASRVRSGATVEIRWRGTLGSTCLAGGSDPRFQGPVPTSGLRTSSPVTEGLSYTLRCTNELGTALSSTSVSPGIRRVRWVAPTRATDGRTIVSIQTYRIYAGRAPDSLSPIALLPGTATSADVSLANGTWYLTVSALARVRTEAGVIELRESALASPMLVITIP